MKVLYLFNKVIADTVRDVEEGKGHDGWLFGMLRLKKFGIDATFLELEQFLPKSLCVFLRKYILTMHYAHLPLFLHFFGYDVVFTSTAYGCLFLKSILRIKKFKWVVLDFNILGTLKEEKTIKQKFFAYAIARADGIVAISEAEKIGLERRFPHLIGKIIFLHEATDVNFFKPHGTHSTKPLILSVGNYGRDFNTLIEATKDLGVDVLLATKLISKEKAEKLPKHIRVELLSHDKMLDAYQKADIIVVGLKTKDEYCDSVGTLAVGEALSMGKPTIVTHTKSMESYITNGVNGILVPPFDVSAMKNALQTLISNQGLRAVMGSEARKFATEHLDAEVFAHNLATFLSKYSKNS